MMADTSHATPELNLVAIDVARYWNYVLIETSGGKRHRFKMANTAADIDRLLAFLQTLPGTCRIGLEPTGDYHRALAYRLLTAGFEVVSINSVAQARYRDAMFNSWDKNDPKDAAVILEMLRRHTFQRYVDPMIAGNHDLQELLKEAPNDADRRRKALTAVAAKMARVAYSIAKTNQPYRRFHEQALPSGSIPLTMAAGAISTP